MQVGVMATDGGPHPPEKWAAITAAQIINIAADAGRQATAQNGMPVTLDEAQAFEQRVLKILTGHHDMVMQSERDSLKVAGPAGLAAPMTHGDYVDDAVDDIVMLSQATDDDGKQRWPAMAQHFSNAAVVDYLKRLLLEHFHSNMMVERSWHADAHRDHEHAKAFHAGMRGEIDRNHPAFAMMNPHFKPEE
jgi:hypothetical protein